MPGPRRLVMLLAAALLAAPAGGQNLDLDELGALVVLPVLTNGQRMATVASITNAGSQRIALALDFVSGDPLGGWGSVSRSCLLDAEATVTFVIEPAGTGNSRATAECSGDWPQQRNLTVYTGFEQGLLVAAVADASSPPGAPLILGQDLLLGDAVIADFARGDAFAVGAIPFQKGQGQNDGDKVYRFDGQEYARFPGALATTLGGELILFTLDGTLGSSPGPRAKVQGSFQREFDCFAIVPVGAGFQQLVPGLVGTPNDVHDVEFGDGNQTRRRPVHGWVVTTSPHGGMGGRTLHQSTTALVPFGGDQVVLKAGSPAP